MTIEPYIGLILLSLLLIGVQGRTLWIKLKREKEAQRAEVRRIRQALQEETITDQIVNLPGVKRFTKPWENTIALNKVRKHELITDVSVDQHDRIIMTTKPLYVTIGKKDRILGAYQIRIDSLRRKNTIQILNISQRYDEYDGIHIDETIPCLGSVADEVYDLWKKRDLFGLVDTLLYFIVSPAKGHPYVESWKDWLKFATPTPRGFNFDTYDKGWRQAEAETIKPIPFVKGNSTTSMLVAEEHQRKMFEAQQRNVQQQAETQQKVMSEFLRIIEERNKGGY